MKKALIILLVLVGTGAVALAGVLLLFGLFVFAGKDRVPSRTVLEINLETPFIEDIPDDPTARLAFGGTPRVRNVVEALERAGTDDRVAGLVATIGAGGQGLAVIQEVRDAVIRFQEQGKFALAYSETFGEAGPGNSGYYMATAFEEIYLQPTGDVGLTGLLAESPFIRRMLGKLGVTPHMDHRYEYKNAKNMFTETEMTEPHREAMTHLLNTSFAQMVAGIAEARNMTADEVRAIFDDGTLLGEEAVDAGIIDGMAYRDEVRDKAIERAGAAAEFLDLDSYLGRAGRPHASGRTLALVYGVGAVVRGHSGYNPVFGDVSMGSVTVAEAFRDAIDDDDVEGILFRVDSPGGSAVASETIRRETIRAREAGKPVVVSMGNVAASGGYWVSMDAAKIVAQPGTITASIGVLAGKMLTEGFWDWLGIDWDGIQTSEMSTMYSGSYDYTEKEWDSFQRWLDRIYTEFTSKVAAGRDMPLDDVLEIAKGRVWTGEDAFALGLVDELGGFHTALRLLKEEAGIDADASIYLKKFPRPKSRFQVITEMFEGNDDVAVSVLKVWQDAQPMARAVRRLATDPASPGVVSTDIPEIE